MNLEKLFQIFLEQAKKQVLTLCDTERMKACQWLKKIELIPNQDSEVKNLQLHSLKLLLLTIESNLLVGPFEESPIEDKEFTDYNWNSYKLEDFSNMIRSKRDSQKRPEVSYAVSSDRRELVTYQNDPATGQHCYYACSKQPIEEWNNLEGGVIKNQSIGQWKERAEYEELNRKESQNSSVDEPRCVLHATNSQIILNDEQYPNSSIRRSQKVPHFSNIDTDPSVSSRHANYQRNNVGRPVTPQRFGGRGQTMRPYEMEQFGLSQHEQFRSPRGVFQNLDYDRFQNHRSPMPPRLTGEIIESFENARINRGPLSEDNQSNYDDAKQQLCARLQKIRDEMNNKPQAEIEQEIEVEPDTIPYERITLQEPCEDTIHQQHETDQDLGILSAGDMDDEVLFGENQTIDPRTIFKTKDENLVSRNVVKIETNTTIDGNKREVIEEFLEQDDVNVVDRTDNDENLVDVSEPTFESVPGYSPMRLNENSWKNAYQWKCKPRKVLADYSDLPQEDLEDISKPSFQQRSFEEQDIGQFEHIPGEKERFNSGRQKDAFGRVNLPGSVRFSRGYESALSQRDNSERLENVSEPIYASSCFENSDQRQDQSERSCNTKQREYQSFEESSNKSRHFKRSSNQRPMLQIETMDELDKESEPFFETTFNDTRATSGLDRGIQSCRGLPQVEVSEILDEVSQPSFLHSTEVSCPDARQRCRYRIPQGETLERLDDVSQPGFASSLADTYQSSTRRNGCPLSKRGMPQFEPSERLDEVSQPSFVNSTEVSHQGSVQRKRYRASQRPLLQGETSERLDDISQSGFASSFEDAYHSSTRRNQCPLSKRGMTQVEASEILDDVSQPSYLHSTRVSHPYASQRSRYQTSQRPVLPSETSERLDEVSHPDFASSFEDAYHSSTRRNQCPLSKRGMTQVEASEILDDVSQPSFLHSTEVSHPDSRQRCRYRIPQREPTEKLDEVSHPEFESSLEDTHQSSLSRNRCPLSRRGMPKVETLERLDQVTHPSFMSSFQDSRVPYRQRRDLNQISGSERLDEISQPEFLHSTAPSFQDSKRRTSCGVNRRQLPKVETSEMLDEVSHPRLLCSAENTFQDSKKRSYSPSIQRPQSQVYPSERLDGISPPSFGASYQDSTGPPRQSRGTSLHKRLPEFDISEKLYEVSQPEFLHSTEASCQDNSKRTRCPRHRRPLPEMETSKNLDQISHPQLLSSIEDTFQNSTIRGRCPIGRRHLPQIETSEKLDEISKPSFGASLQDSTVPSRQYRLMSPKSFRTSIETSERLDEVSQPEFLHSTEASHQDFKQRTRAPMNRNPIPQEQASERLDQISQPRFLSSIDDSNEDCRRKCEIFQKSQTPGEISEELEQGSQPSYLAAEFPSSFKDNLPPSISQTRDRNFFHQVNVSENLADVSQPFCPFSFEDTQPDLTSFEDTGYESKDSWQVLPQRPFSEVERSERLEDTSQPNFQPSYNNSTLQSKGNRYTEERRPLTDLFNNTHHTKSVGFENLEDVCQPSFQSSFEESNQRPEQSIHRHTPFDVQKCSQISTGSKQNPRQILLSRLDRSEVLEDISQPFYPSSFQDSMSDRDRRHIAQVSGSEYLDNVTQPGFQSSFDDSRQTPSKMQRTKTNNLQELNDISQPTFPTSFKDSIKSTERALVETPKGRPLPIIDVSERLEDICQPSFGSSFEESSSIPRRREKISIQKPFTKIDESSEQLEDVSQPSGFPCSLKHSSAMSRGYRLHPSHTEGSDNHRFESSKQASVRQRPFPQVDNSERLNEISEPDFATTIEGSNLSSKYPSEQCRTPQQRTDETKVSERLDEVCQPSFPNSFDDSRGYSRKNETSHNRESFSRKMQQNRISKPPPIEFDTADMLEDILQPEFPSTFQETSNISLERKIINRQMPQIDFSENIESVCQPDFPLSFNNSTRNEDQNLPSTYRKNNDYMTSFPKERVIDISAPRFHDSNYEDSMQRARGSSYLPREHLEDISCPFQTTPKLPSRCRRQDYQSPGGPPRQLFPRSDSRNRDQIERPGDFRKAFEAMPNYAPFEQQVASRRNPITSKLKKPINFGCPMSPLLKHDEVRKFGMVNQCRRSHTEERPNAGDLNACRMRPPAEREANPSSRNRMESRHPGPTLSSTRIPPPPSARTQANVQCQEQRTKMEKQANQERLVKKSSVKFHQTKSTYFKNNQDQVNRNQRR